MKIVLKLKREVGTHFVILVISVMAARKHIQLLHLISSITIKLTLQNKASITILESVYMNSTVVVLFGLNIIAVRGYFSLNYV